VTIETEPAMYSNQSRLCGCERPHEFEPIQPTKARVPSEVRYRCRKCQGEINAKEYQWYLRGCHDGMIKTLKFS